MLKNTIAILGHTLLKETALLSNQIVLYVQLAHTAKTEQQLQ
jgi:hypothetical protein